MTTTVVPDFGVRVKFNTTIKVDDTHVDFVRDHLSDLFKLTPAQRLTYKKQLPCSQPTSLTRTDFKKCDLSTYMFTPKADGTRYYMVFISMQGIPICMAIDRAYNMFPLDVDAPDVLFNGTVLDVELMSEHLGLVMDVLQLEGQSMVKTPFFKRYKALQPVIDSITTHAPTALKLECKCVLFNLCLATLNSQPYSKDGIILQPQRGMCGIGRVHNLYRVKNHETIDVVYRDGKYYAWQSGKPLDISERVQCKAPPEHDGLYEFTVTLPKRGAKNSPLRLIVSVQRTDKLEPNDVSVLLRLREILRDTISPQDLLNAVLPPPLK